MVGKTISHYKVIEKIGQEGRGEVYRAEDTNLSREVAIKVLPRTVHPRPAARRPSLPRPAAEDESDAIRAGGQVLI